MKDIRVLDLTSVLAWKMVTDPINTYYLNPPNDDYP